MAIISIPTSIGGLNIPGGIFGGPLSDLMNSGSSTFSYQYPRDLGSSNKAHAVYFTIKEVQEVNLAELPGFVNQGVDALTASGENIMESFDNGGALGTATEIFNSGTKMVNDAVSGNWTFKGAIEKVFGGVTTTLQTGAEMYEAFGSFLNEQRTTNVGQIALYMPENFNLTSAVAYDDSTSLASAMGALPLIGGAVKTAQNLAGGGENDAFKLVLNRAGYVFNPQKQLLFQGVEFRDFQMSFTFTPYSAAEAEQVKNIIEKFRMFSSPKRNENIGKNMFWVPPALFEIDFKFNGQHNANLPKLKDCVIESIDVNYTPNGWAAHTDGAPVQTTITMQFKEISLIGRDDIAGGY